MRAVVVVAASWQQALEQRGFVVQEGQYGFFGADDCQYCDTCYAANPLTPYGLAYLPPHPNETATQARMPDCTRHGPLCVDHFCRKNGTLKPVWRLAKGETVVLTGTTPPEATYFSWAPNLYSTFHPEGWKSNAKGSRKFVACAAATDAPGDRCEVFAGINDPVNHRTLNVTASPFSAPFALVHAWDAKAEQVVQAALAAEYEVSALRYPGALAHAGVSTGEEDEWISILRAEGIKDQTAADKFYAGTPIRAFRVTPPSGFEVADTDLYASFEGHMRPRETGQKEHAPGASNADLAAALVALEKAVVKKHDQTWLGRDYSRVQFESFVKDSGYECLADGTRCQGDCRDTIYAKGTLLIQEALCNKTHLPCKASRSSRLSDAADDFFYVLGVNHAMTNQSSYSSITAYNFPALAPVGTPLDNTQLAGSAKGFFPSPTKAVDYLYAVKFARSCGAEEDGEACMALPLPGHGKFPLAEKDPVVWLERMYVDPATGSGPAVDETLLPVLLHFKASAAQPAAQVLV